MTQLYCKVGKAPPSWSEGVTYPFTVYTARINPDPCITVSYADPPAVEGKLLEVTTAVDGMICTGVRVASLDGKLGQVGAPAVVLRGSGIENARMLLLSRSPKEQVCFRGMCKGEI